LVAALTAGLIGFLVAEARAAEPILPLALFSNRVFAICCAVGFIVGLAMFGSVTYGPKAERKTRNCRRHYAAYMA